MNRYIKSNGNWHEISHYYLKQNGEWVSITEQQFVDIYKPLTSSYGGFIEDTHHLSVNGLSSITGETCELSAMYDNIDVTSACTWAIISGGDDATINSNGVITIMTWAYNSNVTVQAAYSGLTATKSINLTYMQGTEVVTETDVFIDESGNTYTSVNTTISNQDGSTQVVSNSVLTDEN